MDLPGDSLAGLFFQTDILMRENLLVLQHGNHPQHQAIQKDTVASLLERQFRLKLLLKSRKPESDFS